jgi:Xaa-Pro aminopeptidase
MRERRLSRILELLEQKGLHACILKGMDNIFYVTGFRGSEGTALITRGDVLLLTDSRYITYAQEVAKGCIVIETRGKSDILDSLFQRYGIGRVGFDSYHTTYQTYQSWTENSPAVEFVPLTNDIESIRQYKEPEEILAVKRAIDIATQAFTAVFEKIVPGRTEKEIANELDYTMRRLGADGPSFETIVASGPRAALPHAQPTDKTLEAGEAVIVDFGCQLDGYCSDETCTVLLGEIGNDMKEIYETVYNARQKGIEAVRAGLPAIELDMIGRGFIEEKGYGEYFRHGTGHGVGIAVHEPPSVTVKAEGLLEENMIITIEPGIYIPHLGGVRLEDMVLVTESRGEVLTRLRKDLVEIGGLS